MLVGGIVTAAAFQFVWEPAGPSPPGAPAASAQKGSPAAGGATERLQRGAGAAGDDGGEAAPAAQLPPIGVSRSSASAAPSRMQAEPSSTAAADARSPGSAELPRSWPPSAAARASEATDPSWAPYMEQAITTYVAKHPRAAEFPGFVAECRASFCELGALVVSDDSWPAWNQLLYDIRRHMQPEFVMYNAASRQRPDGPRLEAILERAGVPSPDVQQLRSTPAR